MRCLCSRCSPFAVHPVMGRGLDAAAAERAKFYRQLAREIGLTGPDYEAASLYVGQRYGGR